MRVRIWAGGLLALVGGMLMVASGYISSGLLFLAIEHEIPIYLTGFAEDAASLAVSILELTIALGGVIVILAGILLVSGHARTGRILLFLGGGTGFLGLVVSFGYTLYRLGVANTLYYAPYWVGLVLAVVAGRLAKGA